MRDRTTRPNDEKLEREGEQIYNKEEKEKRERKMYEHCVVHESKKRTNREQRERERKTILEMTITWE